MKNFINGPLISIIIPVYNVENDLKVCMKSVINQTYKNLEIILVDDGSTDNSGKLCDDFALEDSRISVIHKKNGGLSDARNVGIENSTGEYIFFIDSDDYVNKKCVEKCMSSLIKNNADISIIRMICVSEDTDEEVDISVSNTVKILDSQKAIEISLYQTDFSCSACGKLFKREIINDIRFPKGRLNEDLAVCHLFFDNADKIVYSDFVGYYYRQRDGSIMHKFNPRRLDALKWTFDIKKFVNTKYPEIKSAADCRTFNIAIHTVLDMPIEDELHDKYFPKVWQVIKKTRLKVLFNHDTRFREKAAAILTFGGEKILKKVWNSNIAVKQKIH